VDDGPGDLAPPDARDLLMNGLSLALGGANVIMQLSRLPVGRGVVESTVESAHPIKRTRTTLGYIVIALFGSEAERAQIRREVDRQHRFVRSNAQSPIEYNAFDPELQLWVAACMYRGLEDAVAFLHEGVASATLDDLYQRSSRFATTLEVPESMWPDDRTAFEQYWQASLRQIAVDETTRRFLLGIASLDFLPSPLRMILGPAHKMVTTGFLPASFREALGLDWGNRRQRLFDALRIGAATANRVLPRPLREFPWNVVLWDTRRRIRLGRPVI
jgi:uncharacterized protein (DUF2236 family)